MDGKIDRIGYGRRAAASPNTLGNLQRHVLMRLGGCGAEMRRANHVGCPTAGSGAPAPTRNSKASASHLPGIERLPKDLFVHQPAARAIDDGAPLLHHRERLAVDDVLVSSVSGV